ncbi:MAG TPA: glycosyltransferase, partial [Terriglobales bacterium]|nr:glycosyltransferase [Terriglobales bacterium]
GAARNAGIAHASADTLTFLDADDALMPESVARRLAVLDARPDVGWVYSDVFVMDAGGRVTGRCSEEYGYAARRRDGRLFDELLRGNFIPVHAVLVRRACLDAVGTFDASPHLGKEDWDLWVRIAHEFPAAYVPDALAYVRRTPGSMMTNRTVMAEATLRAMARIEARFPTEVAAAAADWRRMRAQQYLEIAVSGARSRSRGARLRAILRAIAVRPVQGAAYRTLARLAAGR